MEKNKKSRKVAKVVLAGVSLIAVSAITFGATMAYLGAKTNTKTNVFSANASVKITLTEPNWDVDTNQHEIEPNTTVPKDPTVAVNTGSDRAYIAIGVEFLVESSGPDAVEKEYTPISYNEFASFATLNSNDIGDAGEGQVWTRAGGNNPDDSTLSRVYYCEGIQAAGGVIPALFESVTFDDKTALDNNLGYVEGTARYKDVKIVVTAYAVASEGITETKAQEILWNMANPSATPTEA